MTVADSSIGITEHDGQLIFQEQIIRYTQQTLPKELKKYYAQRHRLFSRYDEGICLDRESWYSVTPEPLACQIAETCAALGTRIILDLFCGAGGNAIAFAASEQVDLVVAVDTCPIKLACAKHNAALYGVLDKITFIEGDWKTMLPLIMTGLTGTSDDQLESASPAPVIFLSPPWGGPQYNAQRTYDIERMPIPASALMQICRRFTPHIVLYMPRQSQQEQVAALASKETLVRQGFQEPLACSCVELHYLMTSGACKALVCYFGCMHTEKCISTRGN